MHSQSQESPGLPGCLRPGDAAVEDSCTIDRRDGSHKSVIIVLLDGCLTFTAAHQVTAHTVGGAYMHVKVSLIPTQHFCADVTIN